MTDLESLPGQTAPVEVHEHVAERFHVVAAALLDAEVRVDGGVARRARQVLVLAIRYVLPRPVVPVLLRQPEINQENLRGATQSSQHK